MSNVTTILGAKYKDLITGKTGVATGRVEYITGCNQALITPAADKNGVAPDSFWVDEQRLERVGKELIVLDNGKTPGFDKAAPIR